MENPIEVSIETRKQVGGFVLAVVRDRSSGVVKTPPRNEKKMFLVGEGLQTIHSPKPSLTKSQKMLKKSHSNTSVVSKNL